MKHQIKIDQSLCKTKLTPFELQELYNELIPGHKDKAVGVLSSEKEVYLALFNRVLNSDHLGKFFQNRVKMLSYFPQLQCFADYLIAPELQLCYYVYFGLLDEAISLYLSLPNKQQQACAKLGIFDLANTCGFWQFTNKLLFKLPSKVVGQVLTKSTVLEAAAVTQSCIQNPNTEACDALKFDRFQPATQKIAAYGIEVDLNASEISTRKANIGLFFSRSIRVLREEKLLDKVPGNLHIDIGALPDKKHSSTYINTLQDNTMLVVCSFILGFIMHRMCAQNQKKHR